MAEPFNETRRERTSAPVTARRPTVVVFDVVETLFSLEPVERALERTGVGIDLYFSRLLRDGFALVAAGDFRPFPELARSALTALAPSTPAEIVDDVVGAFARMPAHADVQPAFEALTSDGVTIATLTNGSRDTTSRLLENAELAGYVTHVITVEEVSAWKPSPRPYLYAAATFGVEPAAMAMVAAHAWDIHGANRAGLTTGWCSRLEGRYPTVFDPPDVSASDLVALVEALLRLPTDPVES